MGYYNPYSALRTQVTPFNMGVDQQGITDRFNSRITNETAARQQGSGGGGQGPNWANLAATTIGQIGGSIGTVSTNPYDFSTNDAGMFTGAAQGFAQAGPVGAAIGAVGGMIQRRNSYGKAQENLNAIDGGVNLLNHDAQGRPDFNSQAAIDATGTMNKLSKESRKRTRGIRGLFASHDSKILAHQMANKAGQINQGLQDGRNQFNASMTDYNNQQTAMTQYSQLLNTNNRMRNLYSIGQQLY